MIDIKKIRKDNINYGAIKVYEWTVSIDSGSEVTDVLLNEKQIKDIFENKYDVLKLNIELLDHETSAVLETLQKRFYKSEHDSGDQELCYSSAYNRGHEISILLFKMVGSQATVEVEEILKADLVNGKVPADQLPSYVDDALEFEDLAHFPEEGERGKIYVALDTGLIYRWSGSMYIQIGGGEVSYLTPILWAELKALKDNGELIPGMLYRITDYVTTTIQENTRSAGHQFDIIVRALSESVLSEEAFAIHHEGDTYFANSKLSTWKLWYCLENDTTRFAWADNVEGAVYDELCPYVGTKIVNEITYYEFIFNNDYSIYSLKRYPMQNDDLYIQENEEMIADDIFTDDYHFKGKGVIYFMKDEWNNECPYDFKNILFSRHAHGTLEVNHTRYANMTFTRNDIFDKTANNIKYYAWKQNQGSTIIYTIHENPTYSETIYNSSLQPDSSYTSIMFSILDAVAYQNKYTFSSIVNGLENDSSLNSSDVTCFNNKINAYLSDSINHTQKLNHIVFYSESISINAHDNTFDNGCHDNTLGNDCYSNTFGKECYLIKIDRFSHDNIFANSCNSITLGSSCYYNKFNTECQLCTISNGSYSNSFSKRCHHIHNVSDRYGLAHCIFGTSSNRISLGRLVSEVILENNCTWITIGDTCSRIKIGCDCNLIWLGNYASDIKIGNRCQYINFGLSRDQTINYVSNITISDNCSYLNIVSDDVYASSSNYLQNVHIHFGVKGVSSTPKTITIPDRNLPYSTEVYATGTTEMFV